MLSQHLRGLTREKFCQGRSTSIVYKVTKTRTLAIRHVDLNAFCRTHFDLRLVQYHYYQFSLLRFYLPSIKQWRLHRMTSLPHIRVVKRQATCPMYSIKSTAIQKHTTSSSPSPHVLYIISVTPEEGRSYEVMRRYSQVRFMHYILSWLYFLVVCRVATLAER